MSAWDESQRRLWAARVNLMDAMKERNHYRVLLERLVAASDGRPDDQEWLQALYAARNALRDQAKEADRG
jgi:hypothetical protein